jgi:hypothetical protein
VKADRLESLSYLGAIAWPSLERYPQFIRKTCMGLGGIVNPVRDADHSRSSMKFPAQIGILVATMLAVLPNMPGSRCNAPLAAQQDNDSRASAVSKDIPAALPKGKKLVLKDGTYQMAREYAVEVDRVRYWSVERSQWEEIPSALVDWDATHKSEAE